MLTILPKWLRTLLAFAAIGFIVIYGQKLAGLTSKKLAG